MEACLVKNIICGDQVWVNRFFYITSIHIGYRFFWVGNCSHCEIVEIVMGEEKYNFRGSRIIEEIVLEVIE